MCLDIPIQNSVFAFIHQVTLPLSLLGNNEISLHLLLWFDQNDSQELEICQSGNVAGPLY